MTKRTFGCLAACFVFAAVTAHKADAAIIFYGNQPGAVQPDENLLFNDASLTLTGTTVQGITNTSHMLFDITGQESLTADGGQARVSGTDGTFTTLTLTPDPTDTFFSEFEANLTVYHQRGPTPTGTVTVSATNKLGVVTTNSYDVGSGQNFFSLLALDPDLIRSITVTSTVALADIREIRVGGIAGPADQSTDPPVNPVPEPAALMLFGFGLIAAGRSLRRRSA